MIRATALLLALVCAGSVFNVAADRGVALDPAEIRVDQQLSKGGTYQLPSIGLRNPGSDPSQYTMGVTYLEGQSGSRPPESWFSFDPAHVTLDPGQTRAVRVTIDIPSGARPDDYEALVQAEVASEGEGTAVAAAAAARLEFTVKPSSLLEAWRLEAETWAGDNRPWLIVAGMATLVGGTAMVVRRRYTFSVGRRV